MIKKLELDIETHKNLISYCRSKNIIFLSSPFDIESIYTLNDLGLEIFKIPSGEITNLPYLRQMSKLNKKVILSTGMSDIKDIYALDVITCEGTTKENITVLHANTMYPTPMSDVNLKAMKTIGIHLILLLVIVIILWELKLILQLWQWVQIVLKNILLLIGV